MKKVLIVLNDAILMSVFKSWVFRSQKKESLLFAKDGKEAISIINNSQIDVLITELNLPEIDGLELITAVAAHHPSIKIAFFVSSQNSVISEKLKKIDSIQFIDKPNSLKDFIVFVQFIEKPDFHASSPANILIAHFFALIALQQKTCLLAVENEFTQEKGLVYFEHGVLYDTALADLKAEIAVVKILRWQYAKLSFRVLGNKKFARQIQSPLLNLIKRANNPVDESAVETVAVEEPFVEEIIPEEPIVNPEPLAVEVVKTEIESFDKPQENQPTLQSEMALELKARFAEAAKAEEQMRQVMEKIHALAELNQVLEPLQKVNNYLAFAIFDMTGDVIIQHKTPDFEFQLEQISPSVVMMIKATAQILRNAGLKKMDFIQMTFEAAIFQAEWLLENQFVAAVLLDPTAKNVGLSKVHLDKTCSYIRAELNANQI